ncbi:hypothetical protein K227x_34040 [Rubripirellula lacrimiformis]|uniref:Planctomycete cytochrome C n=1 Tax=Rubripirellula lacrimiformis TaxID=1930273 RepID=A0A517ND26_9BACT|nr:DUF1592 domain-containing protein [Rubripirellula lacrimiformis]QDT05006.1 hypothetical protein K227x_34040 [Rubripirellula lacrimiformis]
MIHRFLWAGLTLAIAAPTSMADGITHEAVMPDVHRAVLQEHCLDCHDSSTKEGNVDLEGLSWVISGNIETAERWAKVLNAINSGEMPPPDAEPIADDDKSAFLKDLSEQMVVARKLLSDTGGVVTLRRLNRREYANTIESLMGIRPDVSVLPDDQATAGFDTQGASLFMSSDQIEQYLASARRSLELALRPQRQVKSKTVRIEPEDEYTPHYAAAAEEMRDIRRRADEFLGQTEKPAADFGFLDAYQAKKQRRIEWLPLLEDYLNRPETKSGITLIMTIKQGGYTKVKLPMLHESQDGRYTVRVRAAAYPDANPRLHYLEFSEGYGTGRTRLGWRKVSAPLSAPQIIEFSFQHRAGEKKQIWIHQRSHQDRADKNQATLDMRINGIGTPPGLWIDWAELIGPESAEDDDESPAAQILFDKPSGLDDEQYARAVLARFATRAFRGEEVDDAYLQKLVQRYKANRSKGQPIEQALIDPLSIILASPSFLYLVEGQDGDRDEAKNESATSISGRPMLTAHQLAIRLSYFLWSAPPDEELMMLADTGKLLDDDVLRQQTTRLLTDKRADKFVRGFVYQWLQMERLGMFQYDGIQFPTFDNAARESAGEEIFQTFQLILNEGLPLQTLLKADFVVINDLLAEFYGIENVDGHEFRKVSVGPQSKRGGLLGTAAVLAMGSDGQRSSPVERGVWVLRNLLNNPPPPAPPNVPMLSRLDGEVLAARDLARAHQEQPQCANCHQKIDPIGYGLENFDAAGLWRDVEVISSPGNYRKRTKLKEFEIDPSGQLPDGSQFSDFQELRDVVAMHGDDFARGFTESLISYGLGRPYGFTDDHLADVIMNNAKDNGHDIPSFVHALTLSSAFRSK